MLNGPSNLGMRCILEGHVSNQIRDVAHLLLFPLICNDLHSRVLRICSYWIEAFQILKSWTNLQCSSLSWNNQHCVTIEIGPRKSSSNSCIDANSIFCSTTNHFSSFWILIRYRQMWNFKRSTMRIPNKSNLFT